MSESKEKCWGGGMSEKIARAWANRSQVLGPPVTQHPSTVIPQLFQAHTGAAQAALPTWETARTIERRDLLRSCFFFFF